MSELLATLAMKVEVAAQMGGSYMASGRFDDAANVMHVALRDIAGDLRAEVQRARLEAAGQARLPL